MKIMKFSFKISILIYEVCVEKRDKITIEVNPSEEII